MGIIAKAALILALGAAPQIGYAVRYSENLMERVAAARGIASQPCMVAYTNARDADVGRLWLQVVGPAGNARCLVVDMPRSRDRPGLVKRRVIVELDHTSGARVCGRGWRGRAAECPVRITRLSAVSATPGFE